MLGKISKPYIDILIWQVVQLTTNYLRLYLGSNKNTYKVLVISILNENCERQFFIQYSILIYKQDIDYLFAEYLAHKILIPIYKYAFYNIKITGSFL